MVVLSVIVAVLTIIGLIVQIMRNVGGTTTTTTTVKGYFDETGKFHPGPMPPVAMPLSQEEFDRQAAAMPVEWITYTGMTPELRLKIRGTTDAMFRQASRKYINMLGEENFKRLSESEHIAMMHAIMAEAYVLDWSGALYPNGNPIPYSAPSMTLLLNKDPYLVTFLSEQVERLNPGWATR